MKTNDKKAAKRIGMAGGLAALMAATGAMVFFWQKKRSKEKSRNQTGAQKPVD